MKDIKKIKRKTSEVQIIKKVNISKKSNYNFDFVKTISNASFSLAVFSIFMYVSSVTAVTVFAVQERGYMYKNSKISKNISALDANLEIDASLSGLNIFNMKDVREKTMHLTMFEDKDLQGGNFTKR